MPKATAPPTAQRDALAAKSEKSLQMSGLLAKIKDPSVGDLRESVLDAASNKEGAIDRADFERLAAAIKEEAVADYEAKQAMVKGTKVKTEDTLSELISKMVDRYYAGQYAMEQSERQARVTSR